jgi:FMN-dependent NADH-azoreductase
MKLLHIDSSISGAQSVSRQLTASIVNRLKGTIPGIEVKYRDLAASPLPQHSQALQALKIQSLPEAGVLSAVSIQSALQTESFSQANSLKADLAHMVQALEEFLDADIVVIGTPMYNFAIPSQLKSWIDCLAAPGRTFNYTATGVDGLCGSKRIIVASARGGMYSAPSPMAAMEHQESHLSSFFSFIGVPNLEFIRAEGLSMGPDQRQRSLDSALALAAELKAA